MSYLLMFGFITTGLGEAVVLVARPAPLRLSIRYHSLALLLRILLDQWGVAMQGLGTRMYAFMAGSPGVATLLPTCCRRDCHGHCLAASMMLEHRSQAQPERRHTLVS